MTESRLRHPESSTALRCCSFIKQADTAWLRSLEGVSADRLLVCVMSPGRRVAGGREEVGRPHSEGGAVLSGWWLWTQREVLTFVESLGHPCWSQRGCPLHPPVPAEPGLGPESPGPRCLPGAAWVQRLVGQRAGPATAAREGPASGSSSWWRSRFAQMSDLGAEAGEEKRGWRREATGAACGPPVCQDSGRLGCSYRALCGLPVLSSAGVFPTPERG